MGFPNISAANVHTIPTSQIESSPDVPAEVKKQFEQKLNNDPNLRMGVEIQIYERLGQLRSDLVKNGATPETRKELDNLEKDVHDLRTKVPGDEQWQSSLGKVGGEALAIRLGINADDARKAAEDAQKTAMNQAVAAAMAAALHAPPPAK